MPGVISDPIADLLTRIRNGLIARHGHVTIPFSGLKEQICQILVDQGYIESFTTERDSDAQGTITVTLRYTPERRPVISGLRRVSRPGLRRYAGAREIPRVQGGLGVLVVSTSKGVLTDSDARRAGIGGELLCEVW